METINFLLAGFEVAISPNNLMIAVIGAFIGTIVGLLPGLGPTNGVALLMPIAYSLGLPADSALILFSAVYLGTDYGGRISAILLNVPGDAAAVMTTLDGYPLAQEGKAGIALSLSAVSSFFGSLMAICLVILFAPILAKWALSFGPAEYFVLMVLALFCISGLMGSNPVKTLVSVLIGLVLAIVGIDSVSGVYRFTFNLVNLGDGIPFTAVVIGLFSISEILMMLEKSIAGHQLAVQIKRKYFNFKEFLFVFPTIIKSALIGFVVGVLPGAGASVASAMTYASAKKSAKDKSHFGKGDLRGVVAPEAGNNASACGSFIPMLTLGVPGSGTTAIMLGALTLYNITPGPQLFIEQPDLVWGLIVSIFVCNFILLFMNISMVRLFTKLLDIPYFALIPIILSISFIGVYSINSTVFDLLLMIVIGIFGYILRKFNFPLVALILGFVLGGLLETNLRRALSMSQGELGILWSSTITQVLWLVIILGIIGFIIKSFRSNRKKIY